MAKVDKGSRNAYLEIDVSQLDKFKDFIAQNGLTNKVLQQGQIRRKLTTEEKKARKREYGRQYRKRSDVKERRSARMKNPELKARQKEYNQRVDVKLRKKRLGKQNRLATTLLKRRQRSIWDKYFGVADEMMKRDLKLTDIDNLDALFFSDVEPAVEEGEEGEKDMDAVQQGPLTPVQLPSSPEGVCDIGSESYFAPQLL